MRKYILLIILNIIVVLLQSSFLGELFDYSYIPDFVLVFSFAFLLDDQKELALGNAFIGGIVLDLLNLKVFGVYASVLVVLIGLVYVLQKLLVKTLFFQSVMFVLAVTIFRWLFLQGSFKQALIGGVVTSLVSVFLYFVIKKVGNRFLNGSYRVFL